ncbi:MAG: hypothetical protein WCK96_01475 [Methylococcales bacterium]
MNTKEVQQSTLTFLLWGFMLYPLSQKTKDGCSSPRKKGEKSPLPLTVFLCPVISDTGLIRVFVIMVDCFRETLKSFARSFAGTANLTQSTARCLAANGGGLFSSQRNTAMKSQNNSVPNAQALIVLNPQTLAKVMQSLERAENHAGNLAIQFRGHESALEFTEIELEIATAYNLLSRVIMSGVKTAPPPAKPTPPKRQTTGHSIERDGRGYDCRVLMNEEGDDYLEINPECTPPAGYRQVCIHCGFDSFDKGTIYCDCPQCSYRVVHNCRYVAIAGDK